ncbi:MAG: ROK family glucokinase [Lachnospiraceae bacterium]|nr:ROK family glucokinase [Lachnospiraceae bacterium]
MLNVGVDLGGTTIKAGVVNEQGQIIKQKAIPTGAERSCRAVVEDMADLVLEIVAEAGYSMDEVASVGIGSPGAIDPVNGLVVFAANFADFRNVPIVDIMKEKISVPVYLENDANVAALGESVYGAGNGCKNTVAITLGTGLGGGIIINGKIYSGGLIGGGEMGHQVIVADGIRCTCGRKGCWEVYSAATALVRMAKEEAEKDPASLMNRAHEGDISQLNGKDVFDAIAEGDAAAKAALQTYAHYLAIGLGNTINVFTPEYIIIGGGPSAQGSVLLDPVMECLGEEIFGGSLRTKVVTAKLGNNAGIVGASLLGTVQ